MEFGIPEPPLTPPCRWIDSHAHLDRLPDDAIAQLLTDARNAGVSPILAVGTDLSSSETVARFCTTFPDLYGAAGVCPFDIQHCTDDWEERLGATLDRERMVAVGEIGIDRSNPRYPPFERQLPVFLRQLRLARERDLPVVVHSRGAEREVAGICREQGVKKALFHCFTGSQEALDVILSYGYYVSFSGIVTFSDTVLERAAATPPDRLFIETDCPYLAPVPHRGKPNRPAWVAITGETVAKARGIPAEALQTLLADNFDRLFLRK